MPVPVIYEMPRATLPSMANVLCLRGFKGLVEAWKRHTRTVDTPESNACFTRLHDEDHQFNQEYANLGRKSNLYERKSLQLD